MAVLNITPSLTYYAVIVVVIYGCSCWRLSNSASAPTNNNNNRSCTSDDIHSHATGCLEHYRAFQERHKLTGNHLFTSVDVEIIRTLCSDLKASMLCANSLKHRCSSTLHNKIDATVRPYLSVIELCEHDKLYEEYAMNQNCLHGQRDVSEMCYRQFLSNIHNKDDAEAIHYHYCGYLSELVACVRSNFAITCGESSALLVELLVKAAVDQSYKCRNGAHANIIITTSPQKSSRVGSHRRSNIGYSFHEKKLYRICLTLSSIFALLFAINRI